MDHHRFLRLSLCGRDSGISNLGVLLTILIFGSIGYVAFTVLPFYYGYLELQGHFEEMASKASIHNDKHIREFLEKEIRSLNIPAEPKDLVVKRQGRTILIELEYTEYFTVNLGEDREYDLWVFDFHPKAEDEL